MAAGLLKAAVDFGLLRGSTVKQFGSYHLPERSFLYLLHALREEEQSPRKIVDVARVAYVPHAAGGGRARAAPAPPVPQAGVRSGGQSHAAQIALRQFARVRREDGGMTEFEQRLSEVLEPLLGLADPRERISAYHDMPYALFRYSPEDEYAVRRRGCAAQDPT